jgi:hypothetical protein
VSPRDLQVTGDTTEAQADRRLYVNLVLINLFLQKPQVDNTMKIKATNLKLGQATIDKVVASLDGETASKLIAWVTLTLSAYAEAFKAQKGSFRTKYEEGIPSGVIETLKGQEQGKNLLTPIRSQESWVWHPLFLNTDSQFELLDRKIPS